MSEENVEAVERVRRLIDAFNANDGHDHSGAAC
jgi:hypothetical protein